MYASTMNSKYLHHQHTGECDRGPSNQCSKTHTAPTDLRYTPQGTPTLVASSQLYNGLPLQLNSKWHDDMMWEKKLKW